MRGLEIVDPQVDMDLLRRPVGPVGRNMVRRELNAEPPLAVHHHAVPTVIVVCNDRPAQQSSPEGTDGVQVGCVEDDDRSRDLHEAILRGISRQHYGDAEDAEADLGQRTNALEEGQSLVSREPYSNLLRVEDSNVEGSAIVIDVSPVSEGFALQQMAANRDFGFALCREDA